MFSHNEDDLQFLFESAGQLVLVNGTEKQVILTNSTLPENEERYIHSIERVLQGDLVVFDNENYLTISESISKRYGKFKAKLRHCNFLVRVKGEITKEFVGYTQFNEPVYREIEGEPYFVPAIVDYKSFAIEGSQILVPENDIHILVQDNELNRIKFAVNNTFNSMDYNWKVRNIDKSKRGLLFLICEKVV